MRKGGKRLYKIIGRRVGPYILRLSGNGISRMQCCFVSYRYRRKKPGPAVAGEDSEEVGGADGAGLW